MFRAAFLLFLLVLFPVVGISVFVSSLGMLRTSRDASGWPTVDGVVLSSEVVTELASTLGDSGRSSRDPVEVHKAQVRYEYVVDGKKYAGDRISLQEGLSSDRYQAELTANKFKPGNVRVYYDPEQPDRAVLLPEDVSGIIPGIVIGLMMMVVPTGLILAGLKFELIERPELPLQVRMWWDTRFGKYRGADLTVVPEKEPSVPSAAVDPLRDAVRPLDREFIETLVQWNPGRRVELARIPSHVAVYLSLALVVGVVVAWVGTFPMTYLIYGRDAPHLPELASVFTLLSVASGSVVFFLARLSDRGSRVEVDWNDGLIRSKREFASGTQLSICDVQSVIVGCVPVNGRPRRFRAMVSMNVVGDVIPTAHTSESRRKAESARAKALTLAEPLAAALGVSVEFEGWGE